MSTDDRILRLENAMATLAELSANQEGRIARLEEASAHLEETTARLQDSTVRLQDSTVRLQELTANLQESFVMLVQLARNHNERLDEVHAEQAELRAAQADLRAAQAESERKIAALADAQIHTEGALTRLTEKVDVLTGKVDIIVDLIQDRSNG
jgi:predicted nuclease with TOPRIM domain